MDKIIREITGKVQKDPYGHWEDCSPGIYLDGKKVDDLFAQYRGKTLKVTIEEVEPQEDEE